MKEAVPFSLGPRLEAAAAYLGGAQTVADVGCDHGKLSVSLVLSGDVQRVIAADISESSLDKARQLARRCGVEHAFTFVCGDGLSSLTLPKDGAAVIAGMGGEEIMRILCAGERVARTASRLVLQPMGGEKELRGYLYSRDYEFIDECVVAEGGRFYQLLCVRGPDASAGKAPEPILLEFGAVAYEKRDAALHDLLKKKYASRAARLKRAEAAGKAPEGLKYDVGALKRLLDGWEDK